MGRHLGREGNEYLRGRKKKKKKKERMRQSVVFGSQWERAWPYKRIDEFKRREVKREEGEASSKRRDTRK